MLIVRKVGVPGVAPLETTGRTDLVDDGIATGGAVRAALQRLAQVRPALSSDVRNWARGRQDIAPRS
ncbi:hypothetical protein KTN05_15655 [Paracoccus sp. Z118]|uniref:hypothetical protein n=1 Tax=Paracoccus sp. Z118 TaxID=2851017 RepID=UPI001C2C1C59|nr:hypothetical protein [Paracoccus sp. Z118]MBV0893249.1 hypothetical protein [Paracoccus sp. Z118]